MLHHERHAFKSARSSFESAVTYRANAISAHNQTGCSCCAVLEMQLYACATSVDDTKTFG